jgi:vacuolar-type H+-ATPase subunit I/STV1
MVFGPTPMRRLYLAAPIEYEDNLLSKIGEMGVVQLIKEFQTKRPEKARAAEIGSRFERLNEKLDIILAEEAKKKGSRPEAEAPLVQTTCEQTEQFLTQAETELNDLIGTLDRLEREVKDERSVGERLQFLIANGLRTDEIGIFRHIFVRIGFMKTSLATKLATYISGTSVVSVALPGRRRENFVIVAGLNDDRVFVDETLKLLNFEEITIPHGLDGDSRLALDEIEERIRFKQNQILETRKKMLEIKAQANSWALCVSETIRYEEAKELVMRTKTRSLIHGWIPYDKVEELKKEVEEIIPKESLHLQVEEPKPEDTVPVQFTGRGIVRAFELLTFLQGVPNYFEVNPTPIYTLLYVVMFGMMFGDIGAGIVLIMIGAFVTRLRRGLFAFSLKATKQIAYIMISCGLLTVVFGFFYGVFFLVRTPFPNLLSPLTSVGEIIVIALAFGVAQIILSLVLNMINMTRRKEPLKVILGEHGATGLAFYTSGVVVGYRFILQRNFDVFFQGDTAIFSSIALLSLVLIFLSPLIESVLKQENVTKSRKVIEGFGLGLEAFIAFIANSVSYIRLAAFAIAHEAIGIAAVVLGAVFGSILSLALLNVLDFAVEGFASFIQSLRLMYYEFSTRFFLKTGIPYTPFKMSQARIKL